MLDGGNVINDAMLSGALDIASSGVPGFLTLWAKAKDNPAQEVRGLTGMSSSSMYLMTRNPSVKSLKDFTDKDRIAVPGIKTSLPAVLLHMAAAKEFGDANYAKLDPITVGLPHPEALTVLLSGRGEIDSHMASPPFSYIEDATPGLHRVFNSVDLLGNITLDMTYTTPALFRSQPEALRGVHRGDERGQCADRERQAARGRDLPRGVQAEVVAGRSLAHPERSQFEILDGSRRHDALCRIHVARGDDQGEAGVVEGAFLRAGARAARQLTRPSAALTQ